MEKYKEYLVSGFANKQAVADLLKWYGSKEKAKEADYMDLVYSAVEMLAENYGV